MQRKSVIRKILMFTGGRLQSIQNNLDIGRECVRGYQLPETPDILSFLSQLGSSSTSGNSYIASPTNEKEKTPLTSKRQNQNTQIYDKEAVAKYNHTNPEIRTNPTKKYEKINPDVTGGR